METMANVTATTGYEGIQTGLSGDTLVVRIPWIVSEDHCTEIANELCRIDCGRPGVLSCNVDLSEVANLPLSLAGALGQLKRELSDLGCEVKFLRARPAA